MSSPLADRLIAYIQTHRDGGILLDTNVLLLLLVAQFRPALIGRKRLEKYTLEDAQLLCDFVGKFSRILTTSHILAETSNLAAQAMTGRLKDEFFARVFSLFCSDQRDALHQCPIEANGIDKAIFIRLGLTDAGLVAAVNGDKLLLTDDLDLYLAALAKGTPTINFTHMREIFGLL